MTSGIDIVRLPYRSDARSWYGALRPLPWPIWLDSGFPDSGDGRYDLIAADPFMTLRTVAGVTEVTDSDGTTVQHDKPPLSVLRDVLGAPSETLVDVPFGGGAIGFLAYDLGRDLGMLPGVASRASWPSLAIGLYDWAVVIDHAVRKCWFVSHGLDPRGAHSSERALSLLKSANKGMQDAPVADVRLVELQPDDAGYRDAFARVQRYIRDGDCYQINLARRFLARTNQDAWQLYQALRAANPAPYGALLEYPFGEVLSSSPEQFLRLRGRQVTTRPIKGTRPRGIDAETDRQLRAELLRSSKDRAENVMIVDLLRNDLGRVCDPGSISVPGLFEVETFTTVHHLVSTVSGRLREGADAIDLLQACFPGGSITGAPKRRAMEIIDELEPLRRDVYCGSVIRLGFDGNLDSNIAIRTAMQQGQDLVYWAGGGIVADSQCEAESQEINDKAAAFLGLAENGGRR